MSGAGQTATPGTDMSMTSASQARGSEVLQRYGHALMGTYGTPMRVLERGDGNYVWDADGNRYLDLLGGIAVNALGHAHPAWVKAVTDQAATLSHTSNFFATAPQIALAERLLELAQAPTGSRVFFSNSGAEANEAAFKFARRTGRETIIALEGSFHGRTMGALSMTHKPAIREPFEPMPPGVEFIAPSDVDALRDAMGSHVAAIILEPIQGEAGIVPLSHEFLTAARELATQHGALLIVDEIQTGVARTGAWFAHQRHGIVPDVMTLAKGLGGGFPVGAVIAYGETVGAMLTKGAHGTTFGGNPLAAAAALATIESIESEGLLDNVKTVGEHLRSELAQIDGVAEVRGEGLLLGIGLAQPHAAEIVAAALEAGFIINAPAADTIRLAPALTLSTAQANTFITWLGDHLAAQPPTEQEG